MRTISRTLAALTLLTLIAAGALPSTTASFTSSTTTTPNTVATGTLPIPILQAGAVTAGSVEVGWDAAPAGGTTPAYTLTRSSAATPDPVVVYAGPNTTYTDPGNIPTELRVKKIVDIAAGASHSVAVADDGTVWAWGFNGGGQLGNGTMTPSSVPVQVDTSALRGRTVTAMAAGDSHSVAVADDGTVWAWGYNAYGQLGNGTETLSSVPVQVDTSTLGNRTVAAVTAGASHSVAVADDGTVWAWGYNNYGQLGNGTRTFSSVPVQVDTAAIGNRTVAATAAGDFHSIAVADDGTVWAWGYNAYGQLGNGTRTLSSVPVQVDTSTLGNRTVTAVTAGASHSVAVADDGTVWAWGYNAYGQLGNGTRTLSSVPVQVDTAAIGNRTVAATAAGDFHSIAVADDGTVWAWGYNVIGQLGNGTRTLSSVPVQVDTAAIGNRTVTATAAGNFHSIAVADDGSVWAWGNNDYGQLGNDTPTLSIVPVGVAAITQSVCPNGSTAITRTGLCSLVAGTEYRYQLTSTVGGWVERSVPTTVTTGPAE